MTDDDWTWTFAPSAAGQFEALDEHVQDRIVSKLEEIVASEWREPDAFLEPLTGAPYWKLRIGSYRLACSLDRTDAVLTVHAIEHRSGAYTADDD